MRDEQQEINYAQAIYEGQYQAMEADDNVFIYGLGVDDLKGHYGTTKDFNKKFGAQRCFDTPISEDSLTGIGLGAALAGMRPIFVHQRMDFLMLCMNQMVNMASKLHYISNGQQQCPFVLRAAIGRSWGQGAQHSQSLYSFFMHVPGIKVVAPTNPYDAKGVMMQSLKDNNPVVFVEHRMLYNISGFVPCNPYEIEFGRARLLSEGGDITLVGSSYTVVDCVRAAKLLKAKNINADVIDPVSLMPLDIETIRKSVQKTGRIIVVDNDWVACSLSAEILALLTESEQKQDFKAKRMGYAPTPCPTTRCLEDEFYPNPQKIAEQAYTMITGKNDWQAPTETYQELNEFKGPF